MRERELCIQVAWACRILAMQGQDDLTLGHVSARGSDGRIYIKRKGLGLSEVGSGDVLAMDLECNKLSGDGAVHLEAVLHAEVYRGRPDVGAIVHTHPVYATAMGATDERLEFVNHDSVLFRDGVGIYDAEADLVLGPGNARKVMSALGGRRAVLMCNHGILVADKTIPWVVYAALTLERAVYVQSIAKSLGNILPIPQEKIPEIFLHKYQDKFTDEYWQYLMREAVRKGYADDVSNED